MKTSELLKLLKKNGCYLLRNGKRHDIWYSPKTGKQFPVPRHLTADIPNGTCRSIKKDAGIE
jgi:predicted RNA binding protein YcfA (HicA-like mRNA interferase family)